MKSAVSLSLTSLVALLPLVSAEAKFYCEVPAERSRYCPYRPTISTNVLAVDKYIADVIADVGLNFPGAEKTACYKSLIDVACVIYFPRCDDITKFVFRPCDTFRQRMLKECYPPNMYLDPSILNYNFDLELFSADNATCSPYSEDLAPYEYANPATLPLCPPQILQSLTTRCDTSETAKQVHYYMPEVAWSKGIDGSAAVPNPEECSRLKNVPPSQLVKCKYPSPNEYVGTIIRSFTFPDDQLHMMFKTGCTSEHGREIPNCGWEFTDDSVIYVSRIPHVVAWLSVDFRVNSVSAKNPAAIFSFSSISKSGPESGLRFRLDGMLQLDYVFNQSSQLGYAIPLTPGKIQTARWEYRSRNTAFTGDKAAIEVMAFSFAEIEWDFGVPHIPESNPAPGTSRCPLANLRSVETGCNEANTAEKVFYYLPPANESAPLEACDRTLSVPQFTKTPCLYPSSHLPAGTVIRNFDFPDEQRERMFSTGCNFRNGTAVPDCGWTFTNDNVQYKSTHPDVVAWLSVAFKADLGSSDSPAIIYAFKSIASSGGQSGLVFKLDDAVEMSYVNNQSSVIGYGVPLTKGKSQTARWEYTAGAAAAPGDMVSIETLFIQSSEVTFNWSAVVPAPKPTKGTSFEIITNALQTGKTGGVSIGLIVVLVVVIGGTIAGLSIFLVRRFGGFGKSEYQELLNPKGIELDNFDDDDDEELEAGFTFLRTANDGARLSGDSITPIRPSGDSDSFVNGHE
ncbi:uncharacterized protein BJ171DRAFT_81858 [Polychytrium aggregatum]|uniref:uncharacterized protein n=1 Tax=Polychytrium aggregatum TaxID=110093 RepID=UPI0022FE4B3D|nr:uncharacterized protein BJ171DRAFT_81858 [Polychytrium aggregatum]KAI9205017.1 hypothetical protein BJ171DRAFT_81858 [Polychytrium aggregatum]